MARSATSLEGRCDALRVFTADRSPPGLEVPFAPMATVRRSWNEVLTIGDVLTRAVQTVPDREVFVTPEERCTYAALDAGARTVARALRRLSVGAGDNVGIWGPNSVEFLQGFFGAVLIGAVAVPLNIRYKGPELAYLLDHARLSAVLTTDRIDDHVELASVARDAVQILADKRTHSDGTGPEPPPLLLLRGESRAGVLGHNDVERLAAEVEDAEIERCRARVRLRDVGLILYTSGTTAHPKGCMLSHEAFTRGAAWRGRHRFVTDAEIERYWIPGPLFHIGALSPLIGCMAGFGTILTDVFLDGGRAVRLLIDEQPTSAWPWFPAITHAVMDHESFDASRVPSLRFIGQVGPRDIFERIREAWPEIEIFESSGLTEAGGSFGLSESHHSFQDRVVAQGVPVPGVEVRVIDPETGADLPRGELGELLVRGWCLMDGYYRDPENTATAIDEAGWLHTGDLYAHRADDHLVFAGRLKDMLKVGGENVAALEVETCLCEHPAVRVAEVVGVPEPRLDEVPVAFVELEPETELDPELLVDFCRQRLARFKVPRAVFWVARDEWPTSATKVDKRELRRRAVARTQAAVG